MLTTRLSVTDGPGGPTGSLTPRMNLYPAASEPDRLAVDRPRAGAGPVRLGDRRCSATGDSATFRLYRNPGVNWLWLGAVLMVIGGLSAAGPVVASTGCPVARHSHGASGCRPGSERPDG